MVSTDDGVDRLDLHFSMDSVQDLAGSLPELIVAQQIVEGQQSLVVIVLMIVMRV